MGGIDGERRDQARQHAWLLSVKVLVDLSLIRAKRYRQR
jgi:hypothetical protein